jgi:6-phosphofructokinase 2
MAAILTVTVNPALDVSTSAREVRHTHKLRCGPAQFHPGGGGINVARVLHRLGSDCLALYAAGGVTGERLGQLLDAEGVPRHCLPIAQETRESFSVHEQSTGRDYRFVLPGPALAPAEVAAFSAFLDTLPALPRYLVASGSLPPGVPADFYGQLARWAQARGVRFVLDSSGEPLAAALAAGVHLVKPSLRELRELSGQALDTDAERLAVARRMIGAGQAQVVALSLGEDGALLVTAGQAWRARSVPVAVASTIGAGDSFVGGLVWALDRAAGLEQALRYGMAAGAAALLTAGTALCQPADVERLAQQVQLTPAD